MVLRSLDQRFHVRVCERRQVQRGTTEPTGEIIINHPAVVDYRQFEREHPCVDGLHRFHFERVAHKLLLVEKPVIVAASMVAGFFFVPSIRASTFCN